MALSPLAGRPAPPELLIDAGQVEREFGRASCRERVYLCV